MDHKSSASPDEDEARRMLTELVRSIARATARACEKLNIEFDMNDPDVAREVMHITFEAMFLSGSTRKTD